MCFEVKVEVKSKWKPKWKKKRKRIELHPICLPVGWPVSVEWILADPGGIYN